MEYLKTPPPLTFDFQHGRSGLPEADYVLGDALVLSPVSLSDILNG